MGTEKSIGEVVAEEEWVRVTDIRLPPSEKLRGDASSHMEEVHVQNKGRRNVVIVDVVVRDVFEALPAILCAISKLPIAMITSISTVLSPKS